MDIIIISLKINMFSSWYNWKIVELALNNYHSLTHLQCFKTFRHPFIYNALRHLDHPFIYNALRHLDIPSFTWSVKYIIYSNLLRNRPEKLAKNSLFYLFIKLVKINSIFTAMYDYYIDVNEILRITFVNYCVFRLFMLYFFLYL